MTKRPQLSLIGEPRPPEVVAAPIASVVDVALRERFSRYVDHRGGDCWTWTGARNRSGYGVVRLRGRWNALAHRVSWVLQHGTEIPSGQQVLHRCDNPSCVRPTHLFLGTNADNVADKIAKGRDRHGSFPTGTHHPNAKLTPEAVAQIREMRARGVLLRDIAAAVGVSKSSVWSVTSGKTWRAA